MPEKIILFEDSNPTEIFGVQNQHINILKAHFSKLKIIARGSELKVLGSQKEIELLEKVIDKLIKHFHTYSKLTADNVIELVNSDKDYKTIPDNLTQEIIVHGANGDPIKARTKNQQLLVESSLKCDLVFAVGPAGTGKTYTSVALAVNALKSKAVKRIILTRPAVEAGEHLGFLPGDVKEKLDPYLQPLYDALRDLIPKEKLQYYMENGVIQIAPLAFMRGRTLDKAFVILDEAQNATEGQLKMFLTRMGRSARFIVTGDLTQIDLPNKNTSGLKNALEILKGVKGIGIIKLGERDVIRHDLVKKIIKQYDKNKASNE